MQIKVAPSNVRIHVIDEVSKFEPMKDYNDSDKAKTINGHEVYRVSCLVSFVQLDGTWSRSVQVNVKLLEKPSKPLAAFSELKPETVWVTPYAMRNSTNVGLSVVIDRTTEGAAK